MEAIIHDGFLLIISYKIPTKLLQMALLPPFIRGNTNMPRNIVQFVTAFPPELCSESPQILICQNIKNSKTNPLHESSFEGGNSKKKMLNMTKRTQFPAFLG